MVLKTVISVVLGYLVGSISFGYLLTRRTKGVDIRDVGSGNPGAANVFLHVGKVQGVVVAVADVLKGVVAVLAARWMGLPPFNATLAGIAAVVGHNLPVYHGFKGGRGVATATGVFAGTLPLEVLISFPLAAVGFIATKSLLFAAPLLLILPLIIAYFRGYDGVVLLLLLIMSAAVIWRNASLFKEARDKIRGWRRSKKRAE
ncbi:MAG: glycerol-3-phosphate acyltransferase [bacterium]